MVIPGRPKGDPRDGRPEPAARGRNLCTPASGKWIPGWPLGGAPE
jgi:hypothetical protein